MGAINMHSIDVSCEVEADPADGIRFSWTYNNTRNVSPVSGFLSFALYIKPLLCVPLKSAQLFTLDQCSVLAVSQWDFRSNLIGFQCVLDIINTTNSKPLISIFLR